MYQIIKNTNTIVSGFHFFMKEGKRMSDLPKDLEKNVKKVGPTKSQAELYKEQLERQKRLRENMGKIKYKIAVMSGKGGVGKSTVSVNLAYALIKMGYKVGLLDADLHGPDVPLMAGIKEKFPYATSHGILPIDGPLGLKVMSIQLLLEDDYTPIVWMGPIKVKAIEQFLADVIWGELDYLIIDLPPGTGDEAIAVTRSIPDLTGIVIVVTPQEVALLDAKKSVNMAKNLNIPVIGVIENMSGFICPNCGKKYYIFGKGGGEKAAKELSLRFLGDLPIDPRVRELADEGKPFVLVYTESEVAKKFTEIASKIDGIAKELAEKRRGAQADKIGGLFKVRKD